MKKFNRKLAVANHAAAFLLCDKKMCRLCNIYVTDYKHSLKIVRF